jgi:hypothetical protein
MLKTTAHRIFRKSLCLKPHTPQVVQKPTARDKQLRLQPATTVRHNISYVYCLHWWGKFLHPGRVNRHNCAVWSSESPTERSEYERDSHTVNVCYALTREVIGPFFFDEEVITSSSFVDMLEMCALPQLNNDNLTLQLDGAPFHFAHTVRDCLNENFSRRWIGKGGPIAWSPPSPHLTALDFTAIGKTRRRAKKWISWINSKHGSLQQLRILQRVWQEVGCMQNYRWRSLWSVSLLATCILVCEKNCVNWWINYLQHRPIFSFLTYRCFGRPSL